MEESKPRMGAVACHALWRLPMVGREIAQVK